MPTSDDSGSQYYSVEVGMATHDDLQLGLIETETVWVAIAADYIESDQDEYTASQEDVILLACQFAHSFSRNGGMPTVARLLNWPT